MSASRSLLIPGSAAPRGLSAQEVGGKAWNLFRLRSAGFDVPAFCVLPAKVFDEAIARHRGTLAAWIRTEATGDGLASLADRIGQLVRELVPAGLGAALLAELPLRLPGATRLAVRSSVVDEDGTRCSFAGLMDSRLNVTPEAVAAAIADVWASSFSARALAYRLRRGLNPIEVSCAVILQEMVPAQVSGVLFTRHPETHAEVCLLSAGYGLGEGIVSDAVTADEYRVPWAGSSIAASVRQKETRVEMNDSGGTRTTPVPAALRDRPALDKGQLLKLRDLGRRAECALGAPQDMEWALDEGGGLHVLQARPLVPPAATRRIWDNANIVESYPGLTLPLTFSFVKHAYARTFRRAALAFLPWGNPLATRPELFGQLLGLIKGRVYYNLTSWYTLLAGLPAPEAQRQAWNRLIGVTATADTALPPAVRCRRVAAGLAALWVLLRMESRARRFFARFERLRRSEEPEPAATTDTLEQAYRSLEEEAGSFWHLTVLNDFCALAGCAALTALCARFKLPAGLPARLLGGARDLASVAPLRSLLRIVERVRREPAWRERFAEPSDKRLWEALRTEPTLAALRTDVEAHLNSFGDRGVEELKLETLSFREQPARVIGLMRAWLAADMRLEALQRRESRSHLAAEAELHRHGLSPARRFVLRWVAERARAALRHRESMRLDRSFLFGRVRRIFRQLGEAFAARGLLAEARDIFYLEVEEALGVVTGTAVTQDLRALVAVRKAEYERFALLAPGPRVETVGPPALHSLAPSEERGEAGARLLGHGCSAGTAVGRAQVVRDPRQATADRDRILVARSTDPGWVFLMVGAAGIVAERGSLLSHTAIVARELGIPAVVGVEDAVSRIPEGARLAIDGASGEVLCL